MRWVLPFLSWVLLAVRGCEREQPDPTAALHEAVSSGVLSRAKRLLKHGADINAPDASGWTPLQKAARMGHAPMVGLLLDHWADPDADGEAGPALHNAVDEDRGAVVAKLLAGGADVNLVSDFPGGSFHGVRPLDVALYPRPSVPRTEMVEKLLAAGANPDLETKWGTTPLYRVAGDGDIALAERFLALGARVNVRDEKGTTPLHVAAWANQIEIVKLLLDHGADIDSADRFGDTPAHIAGINGYSELFRLLQDSGADLRKTNDIGQTPLDCLSPSGTPDIVVVHADGKAPYEVIVSLPATVRRFLLQRGIAFDRIWIPNRRDIETFDWDAVMADDSRVVPERQRQFNYLREHLPVCNRQYAGFVKEGRRFLVCLTACDQPESPVHDGFSVIMDAYWDHALVIVDLADHVVVYMSPDGGWATIPHGCYWMPMPWRGY